MLTTAVIDNVTLAYLTKLKHLGIFDSLRFLFQQIHVSQEVKKEYEIQQAREPDRVWVLDRLRPNQGFYSYCTRYDQVILSIISGQKGIDKGEAEVYAQHKRINAHYILSDDHRFSAAIREIDPTVKILTTLHIIAMLDIREFLVNCEEIVKALHSHYKFSSYDLRAAYIESAKELGLTLPKKTLNIKCSLKKMGLN